MYPHILINFSKCFGENLTRISDSGKLFEAVLFKNEKIVLDNILQAQQALDFWLKV